MFRTLYKAYKALNMDKLLINILTRRQVNLRSILSVAPFVFILSATVLITCLSFEAYKKLAQLQYYNPQQIIETISTASPPSTAFILLLYTPTPILISLTNTKTNIPQHHEILSKQIIWLGIPIKKLREPIREQHDVRTYTGNPHRASQC